MLGNRATLKVIADVAFHLAGPDPRITLRSRARLGAEDLADVQEPLDALVSGPDRAESGRARGSFSR